MVKWLGGGEGVEWFPLVETVYLRKIIVEHSSTPHAPLTSFASSWFYYDLLKTELLFCSADN